jgi:hypothetical protein
MAQLNFNALAPSGPVGFSQGFSQGRKEKTASEMDRLTLESGRFKMDEMKRDRAEMLELQEKLKGLGQDPDLNKFFDTISATGNPKYVEMANQGRQKLKDQLSFANILGGGVAPQAAPQPQAAPSEPYPGYNEEIGMAAPANALAARQAPAPMPAAPVNAMAPQQPGGLPTQNQINAAYRLGTPAAIDWANKAQKFLVDSRESQLDRASREGISTAGIAGRASEGLLDRGARASEGGLNRGVQTAGQVSTANTAALNAGRTAGQLSAAAEKVNIQNKQAGRDIALAISEITEAIKPGGLLEKSTGSGIGRLYDVSAGFFGNAPAGAIAIGQLQPVADLALKMVPRFEGPQSDKDVLTYRQASGELANPNLPTEIRKRAAQAVLRIMKARKDQFTTEEGAATGAGAAAAEAGGAGVDTSNPLLR